MEVTVNVMNRLYWIWLAETFGTGFDCRAIIEEYGEPRVFFDEGEAVIDEMRRRGLIRLTNDKAERVKECFCDEALDDAKRIMEKAYRLDLKLLTLTDSAYPQKLRQIAGAPTLLYLKGEIPKIKAGPMIGVVGSRRCSYYSIKRTTKLCEDLSLGGATVVSGLAEGIDTAAAKAAIKVNRPTVAVVGCGLDRVYPASNRDLFEKIAQSGAIISEYSPGTPPKAMNFPQRNRIISGMSSGVVVVEAGGKSGALITAKDAERQRREVFVLDCFEDEHSEGDFQGCRVLAARGAIKVSGAEEIFEYYSKQDSREAGFSEETWDDRYLAWNGEDEPGDIDETEWLNRKGKTETPDNEHQKESSFDTALPIGVKVMLPEDWPEAPQYAADPRKGKFSKFLKKMKVERGIYGGTVITFDSAAKEKEEVTAKEPPKREVIPPQKLEKAENVNTKAAEGHIKAEKAEEVPFFGDDTEELSGLAKSVLKEISDVPIGMDELSGRLNVRVDKLAAALAELEINGYVVSLPGARYLLP